MKLHGKPLDENGGIAFGEMTTQTPRTDAVSARAMGAYWPELLNLSRRLETELAAAQAKIDRLMLEYCPEEMTKAQMENWAAHQKAVEGE